MLRLVSKLYLKTPSKKRQKKRVDSSKKVSKEKRDQTKARKRSERSRAALISLCEKMGVAHSYMDLDATENLHESSEEESKSDGEPGPTAVLIVRKGVSLVACN